MFVSKLLVNKCLEIHVNSLQMEDKDVRRFTNSGFFGYINFLITEITLIIVNKLTQNKPIK